MGRGPVLQERIIVLAMCRKVLSAAHLYDYDKSPVFKLGELHLMNVLWLFYVAFGLMEIWYFYEHPSSPLIVAQTLTTVQLLLIYHSLLNRKPLIRRTIRRLQQIIDDRKFYSLYDSFVGCNSWYRPVYLHTKKNVSIFFG